jgi:hypothetical protein
VSFRFHRHNIVLPSLVMLYFPPLLCCTSLHHNIVLPSIIMFYFPSWLIAKLRGTIYFPKLSIHTSCSYCCVLSVITLLYFLLWKLFFAYIYEGPSVLPILDIYNSRSYWCVLPFPLFYMQNYEKLCVLPSTRYLYLFILLACTSLPHNVVLLIMLVIFLIQN